MPRGPHKGRGRTIAGGSFAEVIRAFMVSPKYDGLAKQTRRTYRYLLLIAEESLGFIPVDEMRPALVQAYLDSFADRPASQQKARTAIKSLERWALVRERLPRPISLGTEVLESEGGHAPWTDEQVAFAERHAQPHVSRIITLAANTGQRGSDLVRMRWSDIETIDGRPGINVEQQKTGLRLWVPFTAALQDAMDAWGRRPGFVLLKEDGRPFTRPQLTDAWIRERQREVMAPLLAAGLVLHGLRGTAVVRLRRAGATIPQITDMVGMSTPMVTRYCRYSVQRENASAAVLLLDRTTKERPAEKTRK